MLIRKLKIESREPDPLPNREGSVQRFVLVGTFVYFLYCRAVSN